MIISQGRIAIRPYQFIQNYYLLKIPKNILVRIMHPTILSVCHR
ncbi:hypothetical protein [Moraxella lacunata]